MAPAVPNLCVYRKVFLNIKLIGILFVVQRRIYPGITFGQLTILLRFWMSNCCCWLYVLFQPRSSVCATRISLGLMINAGMLLASSRRLIIGGPVIALGLTGKFVHCQVRANETYSEAKHQISARNRIVLISAQSTHKWWSTLKSAVFGLSSSLPPLVGGGGTGVRFGWQSWSALGSFWWQAVQGVC